MRMGDANQPESLTKLRKFCRIGSYLAMLATVVSAVYLLVCLVELFDGLTDSSYVIDPFDHVGSILNILSDIVSALCALVACLLAYKIVMTTGFDNSPFTRSNYVAMRDISVVALIAFSASLVLEVFIWFSADSGNASFDFPLTTILISIVAYMFALIFEYGAALQTESDRFL